MKKRTSKDQHKDNILRIKARYKKELKDLEKSYKNSGDNCPDIINSMYVRKVYYRVTYYNMKRLGFIRFFVEKIRAELRYRYCMSIGRPANLQSPWTWGHVCTLDKGFDIAAFSRSVMLALKKAEEDLYLKSKAGMISVNGKNAFIEYDERDKK